MKALIRLVVFVDFKSEAPNACPPVKLGKRQSAGVEYRGLIVLSHPGLRKRGHPIRAAVNK